MNLIQIKSGTTAKPEPHPTITFSYCNGRIYFNGPTVKQLALKERSCLAFFQDQEDPKSWFFEILTNANSPLYEGAVEFKFDRQLKALRVYCANIARTFLRSIEVPKDTVSFYIEKDRFQGRELWRILADQPVKKLGHD